MSERATLNPARLDAFRKEVRDKLSVAFYHGQSRRGVRDGVVMKQCEDFLVEQATELAAAPAAGEGTDAPAPPDYDWRRFCVNHEGYSGPMHNCPTCQEKPR